jgi:hypothetical protein
MKTCDELGVCQGLSAQQCPHCDSFECEVACSPAPGLAAPSPKRRRGDLLPTPTYPFAPGTIEGPHAHQSALQFDDYGEPWLPVWWHELMGVFAMVLLFAFLGGLLVGYMPAILKWVNA